MYRVTSRKTYRSILKTLLNNNKIPCILPLFHQGKYVINLKKKTELFNSSSSKQNTMTKSSFKLPLTLTKNTGKFYSSITFNCNDITTVICSINPSKAHSRDMKAFAS